MNLDYIYNTPRLTLRPYKSVDLLPHLEAVHESLPELTPWLEWCGDSYNQHDANEWIITSRVNWRSDVCYELAIFDRCSDTFVGSISLYDVLANSNSANVGYWIRSSHHRKGIASEALYVICRLAFITLGLTRLDIVTHPDNIASQRTALTFGAKFEGLLRNKIMMYGDPIDANLYSIIPSDTKLLDEAF
ncbi:GNAT family N-acetyltransferase [Photobacterium sanguinicancri]|uniref:GNAT family protein n=1 Tax=Photobacterium sanguinicancri TaxID=875932 RepID=A0AAW7XYH2_9GAMM|nr:GNAT family protein [Photobacterium sanguinicancri]KXI23813.1 acetyltransferase [Photobacterium sanguinicancri]MDO6497137.1 GNAT family protein [Photobacterium sanguinicancri]MDO6541194.1 GNAT family protein [Photobacterium sanguinicancri]OZS44628.1 N-acetyltransferase [Photobacterium sanguinicancri]